MIDSIRNWLYEPGVLGVNVDDEVMLGVHRHILERKSLLRSAFEQFYVDMEDLCDRHCNVDGCEIELGSGAGFFKSLRPQLRTSDVRQGPDIELTLDAQAMALKENSVKCIYAINVFHHLPKPVIFFDELVRVLKPGGGCILVEPHNGVMSRWLHTNLHKDECFDPDAPVWENDVIRGPLSGANQAMAYIVFDRDVELFNSLYGEKLEIVEKRYVLNALRYFCSGGLNFRQILPSGAGRPLKWIERAMKGAAKYWSFHQTIVIRRR